MICDAVLRCCLIYVFQLISSIVSNIFDTGNVYQISNSKFSWYFVPIRGNLAMGLEGMREFPVCNSAVLLLFRFVGIYLPWIYIVVVFRLA